MGVGDDIVDLTALQRENEEVRAAAARTADRARRLARLRGLTARLAASLDRAALFDDIVRAASDLVASDGVALLLVDDDGALLRVETSWGLATAAGNSLPAERTIAGRALADRSALAVEDTGSEPDTAFPALSDGARPGALVVAPIRVEGKPFGVLEVYYREPRAIPRDDVEMLDALSDAAAIALRNATAYARILEQGAELARRNDELARLNDELRRASILKSQFLSTMSHELRTPLTSIIGFSSILLRERRGERLSERQRDNAWRILAAARHLVTLINDILDLSRIEAGRLDIFRRDVDLRELLDGLRAEMAPLARNKGLSLTIDVDPSVGRLVTDGDRLRQVLVNLVGNAIKFTHAGSITVRAQRSADTVLVSVHDTGVGIALAEQERIFDDFYQADQSTTRLAEGTGLGLAISRRLVTLLEGRLTVQSVLGEGSVFTVVLPASPTAHAIAAATATRRDVPAAWHEAHVLVIDDDPEMVVLLERALEGSPFKVTGALSADEGIEKACRMLPDAILLDVMMPETDGWRALHRLKTDPRVAHIPVVMHTIVADHALGFSLGATDYLVKPVEREHLLSTLDRLTPATTGPVLIVDDDETIRTMLAAILSEERVPVRVASDGEEALRQVAEHPPRLVLLDLMMPRMDGFTVLHRLRSAEKTRHIPVVVVTAKTLTPEEEQMLSRDASMVLTKTGVPLERLLAEIRGALEVAR